MENAIPILVSKDKSKRRKKSIKSDNAERRESFNDGGGDSQDEEQLQDDGHRERPSAALEKIQEILNPSFKVPESTGPYVVPKAVRAGDVNAMQDLDEKKIIELKELFTLFDTNADGVISAEDLRATLIALGKDPSPQTIEQMLTEALSPLDFDAFVALMGYKMIELDAEDVLLEAWSKWDSEGTGFVSEERMFQDLITYGERFTELEARQALEDAPMAKPKTLEELPMIDYQAFCRMLGGLRRKKQPN